MELWTAEMRVASTVVQTAVKRVEETVEMKALLTVATRVASMVV